MTAALAPAAPADAGFTLLELLVAMTLLGFLSLLLFGGLKLGTRVWERSQTVTADSNRIRSVQQTLGDDIRAAYPLFRQIDATHASIVFDGEPRSLTFLSARGDSDGAMKRISITVRGRDSGAELDETAADELAVAGGATRILLGQLSTIAFAYFGKRSGEKNAQWHDDWREQTRLPDLVRIRADPQNRTLVWPELVVAPRISADESCTVDPLTHFCQGRQ